MKKSFLENIGVVGINAALAFVILSLRGIESEYLIMLMTFSCFVLVSCMVTDELWFKAAYYPKLFNWQEVFGCVLAWIADIAFMLAIFSETMPAFYAYTASCIIAGVGAVLWFWKVYTPSVLKFEERDQYDRKWYEKRINKAVKAGNKSLLVKLFSRFLRYQCVNSSYQAGSDYTRPFDAETYRTLIEETPCIFTLWRLSKATGKSVKELCENAEELSLTVPDKLSVALDRVATASMVHKYLSALADKCIAERKAGK